MCTNIATIIFAAVQVVFTAVLVFGYVRKQTAIMEVQKITNVRQTLLAESAINFTAMVDHSRDIEKLSKELDKPGNAESIAQYEEKITRLIARNSAITTQINELPPMM